MHKSSAMIGNIAMWAIAGLGVVFFIMIMSGNEMGINGGLYLTYIAMGLGVSLAVLFGLMSMLTGGNLKGALIPVGAFIAVFAIAYVMSDGTAVPERDVTETGSKLIGAGITMTGLAILIAVGAAIYGWIKKLIS